MTSNPRTLLRIGLVAGAAFFLLATLQLEGWFDPMNDAVDGFVEGNLRHTVDYPATCKDGLCQYHIESRSGYGQLGYRSETPRNGTWNETYHRQESIVPWQGIPLNLGAEVAAVGIAVATVLGLLLLGAWRSAAIAGGTAALGGSFVDPLKYGDVWAPYPSGHTIGATLMWGLLLTFTVVVARRKGLEISESAERWAFAAWCGVALIVGLDLVDSHHHVLSDVVLGWCYAGAWVLLALWLDHTWHRRIAPAAKPSRPSALPVASPALATTPKTQPPVSGEEL